MSQKPSPGFSWRALRCYWLSPAASPLEAIQKYTAQRQTTIKNVPAEPRTDQVRVKNIKQTLGIRAIGRKVVEVGEAVQLREPQVFYPANYDLENDDIEVENTNLYNIYR